MKEEFWKVKPKPGKTKKQKPLPRGSVAWAFWAMNDRLMQEGEELTTVESKPERGKKQQPRLRGSVARDLNDCPAGCCGCICAQQLC